MDQNHERRRPGRGRPGDETQIIQTSAGDLPTVTFQRPGDTSVMRAAQNEVDAMVDEVAAQTFRQRRKAIEKATPKPYRPGVIMRAFGYVLSALFAAFCIGIISITLGFILWKYYNHLFQ